MVSVKASYLNVADNGLAGSLGILKTLLNARVGDDTLLVVVDQLDRIN